MNYKEWKLKSKQKYYDLLDVVNYILDYLRRGQMQIDRELIFNMFDQRDIPQFNYLFLDEVQDLPPAMIYLISLIFENGVYYSGDTAQAIQKGVAFKFSDISEMYRT